MIIITSQNKNMYMYHIPYLKHAQEGSNFAHIHMKCASPSQLLS